MCGANLCLSILAAAALYDEEPGEAEDGEDARTNRHGFGEVPIGVSSLRQYIPLHTRNAHLRKIGVDAAKNVRSKVCLLAVLARL